MVGVTQTGFEIKSLDTITDEINASMVAALGSGFDTSLDTPQGQIINVLSDAHATLWELAQSVYASIDVRQASGNRLDQLGEFRRLARIVDETDEAYRARLLAPVNPTQTAVGRLQSAVSNVPDVESVKIYYNDTGLADNTTLQPLTITVVVTGGDDNAVADAIGKNLVFGLGMTGNTTVTIEDNGLCRTIRFTRGQDVELTIDVTTDVKVSTGVCGGTSKSAVIALLVDAFNTRVANPGQTVTIEFVKAVLIYAGIGVSNVTINDSDSNLVLKPFQTAKLLPENINVTIGG